MESQLKHEKEERDLVARMRVRAGSVKQDAQGRPRGEGETWAKLSRDPGRSFLGCHMVH